MKSLNLRARMHKVHQINWVTVLALALPAPANFSDEEITVCLVRIRYLQYLHHQH